MFGEVGKIEVVPMMPAPTVANDGVGNDRGYAALETQRLRDTGPGEEMGEEGEAGRGEDGDPQGATDAPGGEQGGDGQPDACG